MAFVDDLDFGQPGWSAVVSDAFVERGWPAFCLPPQVERAWREGWSMLPREQAFVLIRELLERALPLLELAQTENGLEIGRRALAGDVDAAGIYALGRDENISARIVGRAVSHMRREGGRRPPGWGTPLDFGNALVEAWAMASDTPDGDEARGAEREHQLRRALAIALTLDAPPEDWTPPQPLPESPPEGEVLRERVVAIQVKGRALITIPIGRLRGRSMKVGLPEWRRVAPDASDAELGALVVAQLARCRRLDLTLADFRALEYDEETRLLRDRFPDVPLEFMRRSYLLVEHRQPNKSYRLIARNLENRHEGSSRVRLDAGDAALGRGIRELLA